MTKKWIQDVFKKKGSKGALHRELKVPDGEKIPVKKMQKAEKSKNPKIRKQVQLAETLGKLRKNK